jgi:hypothetical protein
MFNLKPQPNNVPHFNLGFILDLEDFSRFECIEFGESGFTFHEQGEEDDEKDLVFVTPKGAACSGIPLPATQSDVTTHDEQKAQRDNGSDEPDEASERADETDEEFEANWESREEEGEDDELPE